MFVRKNAISNNQNKRNFLFQIGIIWIGIIEFFFRISNLRIHSIWKCFAGRIAKWLCRNRILFLIKYTNEWKKTVRRMGRWVELQQTASLFSSEMKTQAFSLHLLPWLSNFETNQGYKDRQDPALTLIFPINSNEPKFKDTSILVWTTTT